MRRYRNSCLLLVPLLLLSLFAGCKKAEPPALEPVQPFSFYYRTAQTGFSDEQGLICPEIRDLGAEPLTPQEIFTLYFEGPQSSKLISPIPSGTELVSVEQRGVILVIQLRQSNSSQSAIDRSILDACLTKTALQLEGIRQVEIRESSRGGQLLRDITLSENDILLYDSGEAMEKTEITLYFSDANLQCLLPEKRTVPYMDAAQLPEYVIRQLILGPQTLGMVSPLPQGTDLLDVNVESGVCSVDFNADFWKNRPMDQRQEQLALLCVVNTLCELNDINQVQFYVEGRKLDTYSFLSLADPFTMDSALIGQVREELNEFEGILYLPGQNDHMLHSLPVRVRARGNSSKEAALLQVLFTRPSQNGLRNPLENCPLPVSVSVTGLHCVVELAPGTLDGMDEAETAEALRTITATMTSISGIYRVSILSDGHPVADSPLSPKPDWMVTEPAS